MELKKLKVATKRMAGYTGVLGSVRFVDGVSTEYLPRHIRDRMAASMEFVEIDQDGNELPAGAQYRLIRESAERAPIMTPLARQTHAEKKAEIIKSALATAEVVSIKTREELEAIADKGGIKALRDVASRWNVKHRSIPVIIELILAEQEKWVAARNRRLAEKALKELGNVPEENPIEEPAKEIETDLSPDLAKAAATGDLSVALNTDIIAAGAIKATNIKDSSVVADKIVANAVDPDDNSAALHLLKIRNSIIENRKVALNATGAVASGHVDADSIKPGSLSITVIPSIMVTTDKGEALIGSNEIVLDHPTVDHSEIVQAAFEKLGCTAEEWNSLHWDDREDLLRLQLDSRLKASE